MTINFRCLICDLAFEMGKSEQQFYDEFEKHEREQLLATFRNRRNRDYVMAQYPVPRGRK